MRDADHDRLLGQASRRWAGSAEEVAAVATRDLEAFRGCEHGDACWAVCLPTAISRPESDRDTGAERALEPTARFLSTWRCCHGQREVPPITAARIRWSGIAVVDDYQGSTTAVDTVEAQLAVARTKPGDAPRELHWRLGPRRLGRTLRLRTEIGAATRYRLAMPAPTSSRCFTRRCTISHDPQSLATQPDTLGARRAGSVQMRNVKRDRSVTLAARPTRPPPRGPRT